MGDNFQEGQRMPTSQIGNQRMMGTVPAPLMLHSSQLGLPPVIGLAPVINHPQGLTGVPQPPQPPPVMNTSTGNQAPLQMIPKTMAPPPPMPPQPALMPLPIANPSIAPPKMSTPTSMNAPSPMNVPPSSNSSMATPGIGIRPPMIPPPNFHSLPRHPQIASHQQIAPPQPWNQHSLNQNQQVMQSHPAMKTQPLKNQSLMQNQQPMQNLQPSQNQHPMQCLQPNQNQQPTQNQHSIKNQQLMQNKHQSQIHQVMGKESQKLHQQKLETHQENNSTNRETSNVKSNNLNTSTNGSDNHGESDSVGENLEIAENNDEDKKPTDVVLPKALEDVFALKDQRAAEFDLSSDYLTPASTNEITDGQPNSGVQSGVISTDYADADGDSDEEGDTNINGVLPKTNKPSKAEKNKKKKRRKKENRKMRHLTAQQQESEKLIKENNVTADGKKEEKDSTNKDINLSKNKKDKDSRKKDEMLNKAEQSEDILIEYVPERITIADLAPMYRQFYRVFEIFKLETKPKPSDRDKTADNETADSKKKSDNKELDDDDDDIDEEAQNDKEKLSKRKLKKLTRLSVAELKQLVNRPDVVEMHDVTARDPKLLVQLKAHRNTVQVPRHWCFKRKYLQGKRGIEKPAFDLPAFIKKTGIMEMRESLQEKDDAKSLKSKMRERVRPKMGKIDIDYQKLHDAFFKWQTKPRMTIHGDLYYEGKEFETRLKEKKPGDLSEELRIALGMPVGPNSHKIPPPWLIAQQRYGPPPSYPNLKIPGLNAPIPDGTSFGYHAGGWGKPPVDENGKPLYGDVFGTNVMDLDNGIDEGDIERNQWGELESESEESSEEEEEEGEDLTNQPDESGLVTPAEGLVTPSGLTSVPAGMETPENIELRKKKIEAEMEDNETPVLYQVLPEKRSDRIGASMMGSTHVYDITGVPKAAAIRTNAPEKEGTVELALDPSELDDMDQEAMAQRYERQMREQQNHLQKEDLSDMLAEHVARQKSKRKRQQADTTKTTKKYKEFKF